MKKTHRALLLSILLGAISLTALNSLAAEASGVVNINQASENQLTLLPRVGPAIAARIVAFRDESGNFKIAEDLMLVRGIGEKTFQLIEPYVTVSGETSLKEKVRVSQAQTAAVEDGE